MPLIASGGAGAAEHFPPAVEAGADAVLAASVFHFGVLRIGDVKDALAAAGHPAVRQVSATTPLRWLRMTVTRATSRRPAAQSSSSIGSPSTVRPAVADPLLDAGDVGAPQHEAAAPRRPAAEERGGRPERVLSPRGRARGVQSGWARRTSSWWMANSVVLSARASGGQAIGDHARRARRGAASTTSA